MTLKLMLARNRFLQGGRELSTATPAQQDRMEARVERLRNKAVRAALRVEHAEDRLRKVRLH